MSVTHPASALDRTIERALRRRAVRAIALAASASIATAGGGLVALALYVGFGGRWGSLVAMAALSAAMLCVLGLGCVVSLTRRRSPPGAAPPRA